MATNQCECPPKKRKRKAAGDVIEKSVTLITEEDVNRKPGSSEVWMPTTITLAKIKKDKTKRGKILFTVSSTKEEMEQKLRVTFPILACTERFYFARATGQAKLDFGEECGIWSGGYTNSMIKGDSVLYVYYKEEKGEDSGLYSSDSEFPLTKEDQMQDSSQFSTESGQSGADDLQEQTRNTTLISQFKSVKISEKEEVKKASHKQALMETFTAKGSQSYPQLDVTEVNQQYTCATLGTSSPDDKIIQLSEIDRGSIFQQVGANSQAPKFQDAESIVAWLKQCDHEVHANPPVSPLQGGHPCTFKFEPELPSNVNVIARFGKLEPIMLEKTRIGYICEIPASPEMTPAVIPVLLISTTTGRILAHTSMVYCKIFTQLSVNMQDSFGGMPGASGGGTSGGGASGGGTSGGGAYGGGTSRGEASGSGNSGNGTSATGVSGCRWGTYGGGATECQYSRDASQPGSDVVWELCELIQKCSECIWWQNLSQNRACTEDEEDLEDDQLLCSQQSNENYFADTEDCSSVSSGSDSALSDSENRDESLSVPLVYGSSSEYQEADPKAESSQHSHKGEPDMSQEIQATMTEGFTSEFSIGDNKYVGSGDCPEWNTPLPESTKTEVNYEEEDHDEKQDLSPEWALYSEESASHTLLASQDNTPMLLLDVPGVNVENEESQYSDDELSEILHTEKPQHSESSHDISFAPTEVLVNEFDLCENEDAGKIVHSRSEILSIEPNKTDGGAEEDNFDAEQDLSLEQGLFSEEGNLHTHLSLPDDTSVQSRRPEVENKESQEEQMQVSDQFSTDSKQSAAHITLPPVCSNASDIPKMIPVTLPLALQPNLPTADLAEQKNCSTLLSRLESLKISGEDKEFQKSHEQAYTETFPVKGSLSGQPLRQPRNLKTQVSAKEASVSAVAKDNQQHTPVTVGASDDQLIGDISLIEAAEKGYSNRVSLLIEKGADVNQRGRVDTPLTAAAKNGHIDIVRLLIENKADVNKEEWDTPLTAAVKKGHTDISRLLIENGADVNKLGGELEDTPLAHAARNGCTDTVRLLIENKAYLNKGGRDIPLTAAAKSGHTDVVRVLMENGADVNKEKWEDTPLTASVKNGHADIVRLLLENGADLNKAVGMDILLTAALKNGHTDIVLLLLEKGADVNKRVWKDKLLSSAVKNGDTDLVRLLLKDGADVNRREGKGVWEDTPLTAAAKNGHTDIVRLLLENGADFNKGVQDDTPLTAAVKNGHTDIVRLLLEYGADVNKGALSTPLIEGVQNGHSDIVRLLLENGADVNKGLREDTPLTAAVINGNTDSVSLLLENGIDVNKGVREGTPLAEAVKNGHTDLVRLLIENGGDVNYGGLFGSTSLTDAARIGHNDIVRLLVEKGADFSKEGGLREKKKTSPANSRKYENEPREISFDKNREDEAEENDDVDTELSLVSSYPCYGQY